MGPGGVGQAVGDGGPAVAADGIGGGGQHGHIPLAHHIGVVGHLGQQVPAALQEHGALFREEGGAGRGLGKVGLVGAPVVALEVHVVLHGLPGGLLVKAALGLVLGEDTAAVLIDEVVVAQLLVVVGHVAVVAGGVVDGLRGLLQVIPGPGLVGVGHPGGVKHLLVVDQADVVLVLGHAVHPAVGALGVADGDLAVVLLIGEQVGDVGQHAKFGVVQDLVGVHPEQIRQGVALGGGFQLGPILAPAGDLDLDDHIWVDVGCVGIAHGLHAIPLAYVPDLEGQMGLSV